MWDRLFTAVDSAESACYSCMQHLNFFSFAYLLSSEVIIMPSYTGKFEERESIKGARGGCVVNKIAN